MFLLLSLLACSSCGTSPQAPAEAPVAPAPAKATAPATGDLAPAPSREIWGLKIGESADAEILAWIAGKGLACTTAPSVRRTTYRYTCVAGLTPALLPDRKISGVLSEVLFVRGDATPLTHVSTLRKYSLPKDAAGDYTATIETLTTKLGAPTRTTPADTSKMGGPLSFFSTVWTFTDLAVELRMLKAGGDFYSVSETWDLPGAEDTEEARPSTGSPHGSGEKPSWHP